MIALVFRALISSITGIHLAVLEGSRSLDSLGIAERMHWASDRVTTRIEDQVYSLMGIFDINMPLLYGEGNKAFIRLQEEILRGSYPFTTSLERVLLIIVSHSKWQSVLVRVDDSG
jgi:hypothetical protein